MTAEPDAQLRRVERTAVVVLAVAAAAAIATGGGTAAVAGVATGGLLVALSYRGVRAAVSRILPSDAPDGSVSHSPAGSWSLVKYITRFAIMGGITYVMMVRLRAHPAWMFVGASSLLAAVALEAILAAPRRGSPPSHTR